MKRLKLFGGQVLLAGALCGALSFQALTPVAQAAQRGGVVRIVSVGEPRLLNPVFDNSPAAEELYNLIYSSLIRENSRSELEPDLLEVVPSTANGMVKMLPDGGMQVTYRLRPNLKWHDGHPLTSEDILFTWQSHTDPRVKYPPTPGYEHIRGIDLRDPQTAIVTFHQPYGEYYKLFRHILPRHSFRSQHWSFSPEHPYNRHPVGSGPFVLKQWEAGKYAVLDANPLYHRAKPMLDQIRYQFQPEDFRSIKSVVNWLDQAEVLRGMSLASHDYLKNRPDLELHVVPTGQIEHLLFNLKDPIMADRRVRRALAFGTDRKDVADLLLGLAEPAYSDQLKASWKYNRRSEYFYRPDPGSARVQFDRAGWRHPLKDGDPDTSQLRQKDGQPLELELTLVAGNKSHELVGHYLRKAWKNLGVDLKLKTVAPQVMADNLKAGDYQLAFGTWTQQAHETAYKRWHSTQTPPHGHNFTYFRDYQVDQITRELDQSVNLKRQRELYQQLASLLAEELPALPLYYDAGLQASKKSLHNFAPNAYMGATWNSHSWWLD